LAFALALVLSLPWNGERASRSMLSPSPVAGVLVSSARAATESADEFLIVDCLLPGQVRRLGTQATYVSRRRAIKTAAVDCAIRGGEYVAYDRANYATALQVWMPMAQDGDPVAQNYVGEIYEKGLGLAPDYGLAALWFQRAADQGHAPAQINLGQLYEQGLGVPQDQAKAIEWYRKASGLTGGAVEFVSAADPGLSAQVSELETQLARQAEETRQVREQLSGVQKELEATRAKLRDREKRVSTEGEALSQAQARLAEQQAAVTQERERLAAERSRLKQLEAESARLAAERQQSQAMPEADGTRIRELEAEAEKVRAEAEGLRTDLQRQQKALGQQETTLASRQKEVAAKQAEIDKLTAEVARLRQEADARSAQVATAAPAATEAQPKGKAQSAGLPSIEIVDPPLPPTRGTPVVTLRGVLKTKTVVGRIDAPAGLMTVSVNDQPQAVNENNLFQAEVPVSSEGSRVAVVAVDKVGRRSALEFILKHEGIKEASVSSSSGTARQATLGRISGIEFGKYYALVVGNNQYTRLPKLETAANDARILSDVLRSRYGFDVTTLIDANRYQILSALNKLREKLTDKDNLVIYYAGHGELDRVNQRGHWLPVDAEPDSTANWISNVEITDVLNAMSAKHVLVIADSCYSGSLTRSALARLEAGMSEEAKATWLKTMIGQRSRTALTSGGLKPVIDNIGGNHSVFAQALLDALQQNDGILEGQGLFREISARVTYVADAYGIEQLPEYAPIRYAGHGGGDFFFVSGG
jgi:hypothetical protein